MPKEIRNPKSEWARSDWEMRSEDSDFWQWGEDNSGNSLMLHEDSSSGSLPGDLLERTARFGEAVIRFTKKIPHQVENNRLIDQLVGAGTSIGANYCEAMIRYRGRI